MQEAKKFDLINKILFNEIHSETERCVLATYSLRISNERR